MSGEEELTVPVAPEVVSGPGMGRPYYLTEEIVEGVELSWVCEACGGKKELPDTNLEEPVASNCFSTSCGGKEQTFCHQSVQKSPLSNGLNPSAVPYNPTDFVPRPNWRTAQPNLPTSMYTHQFTQQQRGGWNMYDMSRQQGMKGQGRNRGFDTGKVSGSMGNYYQSRQATGYPGQYRAYHQPYATQLPLQHQHQHHHQHYPAGYGLPAGYRAPPPPPPPQPQAVPADSNAIPHKSPAMEYGGKKGEVENDEERLFSSLTQHGLGSLLKILTLNGIHSPEDLGNCPPQKVRQMVRSAENQERLLSVVNQLKNSEESKAAVSGWGFGRQ